MSERDNMYETAQRPGAKIREKNVMNYILYTLVGNNPNFYLIEKSIQIERLTMTVLNRFI